MQCENGDFSLNSQARGNSGPRVHFIDSGDMFLAVTTRRGGATGLHEERPSMLPSILWYTGQALSTTECHQTQNATNVQAESPILKANLTVVQLSSLNQGGQIIRKQQAGMIHT